MVLDLSCLDIGPICGRCLSMRKRGLRTEPTLHASRLVQLECERHVKDFENQILRPRLSAVV